MENHQKICFNKINTRSQKYLLQAGKWKQTFIWIHIHISYIQDGFLVVSQQAVTQVTWWWSAQSIMESLDSWSAHRSCRLTLSGPYWCWIYFCQPSLFLPTWSIVFSIVLFSISILKSKKPKVKRCHAKNLKIFHMNDWNHSFNIIKNNMQ